MNWELIFVIGCILFFGFFIYLSIRGIVLTTRKGRSLKKELDNEWKTLKNLEKENEWLTKWLQDFDLISNNKNMTTTQKRDALNSMLTEVYEHCKNKNFKNE